MNLSTFLGHLSAMLGVVVAIRVILLRTKNADRVTWKLWSMWLISLYALPLIKNPEVIIKPLGFPIKLFSWTGKELQKR